jgi:hypothetical protein
MFEILDAIAQHNQWVKENDLPNDERFEIDVLTGASAGGMTVSMLAQRLLYNAPELTDPYNNALYDAWVRQIDIQGLLPLEVSGDVTPPLIAPEPPANSLLSSNDVVRISQDKLTKRYSGPAVLQRQAHPAAPVDGIVHLGLAISNLSGVDYGRLTQSGNEFVYTDHEDQFTRALDNSTDNIITWEPIRAAAVACGAFPFAFRVQDLLRAYMEYPASNDFTQTFWPPPCTDRTFAYTDGGVFQNEPLGMAKNFVEQLPGGRLEPERRAYLFIAPAPMKSENLPIATSDSDNASSAFGSLNADFKNLFIRLIGAIMGQAEFQDWVTAEHINDQIQLLDHRASQLKALFANGHLTVEQTAPVTNLLLTGLFEAKSVTPTFKTQFLDADRPAVVARPDWQSALDAARTQLKIQYATDYAQLASKPGAGAAEAWIDTVLVLEYGANLHNKEVMLIFDFLADPKLLASGALAHFGGFFDQAFRDHDYDYGRLQAQTCLASYKKQTGSFFNALHWTPRTDLREINHDLDGASINKADINKRKAVSSRVAAAADTLLVEFGVKNPLRWLIRTGYLKGKINRLLDL